MVTYIDFDHGVRVLGARTDSSGDPIDDLTAREDGLINWMLHPGIFGRHDGWKVVPDESQMRVTVGSGQAYTDLAVVHSDEAQQPPYLVRLNSTPVTVTVDPSGVQARQDRIWLVVEDDTWDASGRALARLAYAPGTISAPPDPDPSWHAYLLLATFEVPGSSSAPGEVVETPRPAGDWAPRGTVRPHALGMGPIPSGWLLADGTNGTPDLRGRFLVGEGAGYTAGQTGGANSVSLTVSQMPSHSHGAGTYVTSTDGNHTHQMVKSRLTSTGPHNHARSSSTPSIMSGSTTDGEDSVTTNNGMVTAGAHNHSVGGSSAAAGSGAPHENRPPFYTVVWIVHP